MPEEVCIGIDIGTSKAAAAVVDAASGRFLAAQRLAHQAELPAAAPGSAEQDATRLMAAAEACVRALPSELRRCAGALGVTGQMHGVVLTDPHLAPLGPLVTWQDKRGDVARLDSCACGMPRTCTPLRPGYGLATLSWFATAAGSTTSPRVACTIQDLFTARLAGLRQPVMDETNAASWGGYDLKTGAWNPELIAALAVPRQVLPRIVRSGELAGRLEPEAAQRLGLPPGLPVTAALGDNQAAMIASLHGRDPDKTLVLTLGTGGQLSCVLPGAQPPEAAVAGAAEIRPFPGGRFAVVAAALCGGNAFGWLVETVRAWCSELQLVAPPEEELYRALSTLGLAARTQGLVVQPTFDGERHAPEARGELTGVDRENLRLGPLSRALAEGILRNLAGMMPEVCFSKRTCVVGNGNALRRLPLMQQAATDVLRLPLVLLDAQEEAATGAALLARRLL